MTEQPTEAPDLVRPTAERVARRALALAAVVCRSGIEPEAGHPEVEAFRADLLAWLAESGVMGELEPAERALLETPVGALTQRQWMDASWRGEGLVVLAWALGRCDLPPYDEPADSPGVAHALGFLEASAAERSSNATLRAGEEIDRIAELLFAAHWRLRQFSLAGEPMDFVTFAQTAWFGPLETEGLRFVAGDLAIGSRPLGAAAEESWREVMSIVRERQQAANWLTGQDPVYSEVTCDT